MNYQRSPRAVGDGKRKVFTKLIRDENASMSNKRDATSFIKGMDSFDSKPELLAQLDDARYVGKRRIRDALSFTNSLDDVITLMLPMLKNFMTEETGRPMYRPLRDRVLFVIYNVPELMNTLEKHNVALLLDVGSANRLCAFFRHIVKSFIEPRQSEQVISMAKTLRQRGDISEAGILCVCLASDDKDRLSIDRVQLTNRTGAKTAVCWGTDMDPPGGRHDNDHRNFRNIQILPTSNEIECTIAPYLPLASGENKFIEDPVSSLLDSNFRLLRHDAIASMKLSLNDDSNPYIWKNARIVGLDIGNRNGQWILSFKVQFDFRRGDKGSDFGRALMPGSVVALCHEGKHERLGTITVRDSTDEWLKSNGGPTIGVVFDTDSDSDACQKEMIHNIVLNDMIRNVGSTRRGVGSHDQLQKLLDRMTTYELREISTSFFSYKPILRSIQVLDGISMLNDLVGLADYHSVKPGYFPNDVRVPDCDLDQSQADAIHHAFNSRIALIQGPPGTGKTFIGARVARMIRENTDETILCVCYTNHALDQFLEHMLKAGETRLVRIGGRSKSEELQRYTLWNLSQQCQDREVDFCQRRIKQVTYEIHKLKDAINETAKLAASPCGWHEIASHLEYHDPRTLRFLNMLDDGDGFQVVAGGGTDVSADFLWKAWKKGDYFPNWMLPHVDVSEDDHAELVEFWSSSIDHREAQIKGWHDIIREHEFDQFLILSQELIVLSDERKALCQSSQLAVLLAARIIGATTSGVANHRDLLSEAKPSVILVEEAGEVLEAHVLTSLFEETKHLILIGDHKQLPPKVEHYNLTATSGGGYNLDCSLFERLVKQGRASVALNIQRRMRPSISALIREQTYPTLKDHESVHKYDNVKGVTKNVVFIDHDIPECRDDGEHSLSKSNVFEAEMVVEIARYFLLQGYKSDQIVILTPYLGQLNVIGKLILSKVKEVTAWYGERDVEDMERHTHSNIELPLLDNPNDRKGIRCSSIDNFQGEEADIVIISLVRSNKSGSIGFVKEKQRVNVLLSRARHGMFIVGNASTLLTSTAGRIVWEPVLDKLKAEGSFLSGLPTCCQLHPDDDPVIICNPRDFRDVRPNGGCHRPCTVRLACGHTCHQFCHPTDRSHLQAKAQCSEPCRRVPGGCPNSHPCTRLCKDQCGPCCTEVGPFLLACNHVLDSPKCFEVSPVNAKDELSKYCKVIVEHNFPECSHVCRAQCGKSISRNVICSQPCQGKSFCSHPCSNFCGSCNGHHGCDKKCPKILFCGHSCDQSCHAVKDCTPCEKLCNSKCTHSTCDLKCWVPCASCVEPCDWSCDHQGQCPLVCGAPCSRLPCNERCTKLLKCGHRCPSLCGESCPLPEFCQVCSNEKKGGTVVDMIYFTTYADHDVDQDPIIILPCGHFYSMTTLDGLLELKTVYELDDTGSKFSGLKAFISNNSGREKPKQCPECRSTISSVRRYGRILRLNELRSLERKHVAKAESLLAKCSEKVGLDASKRLIDKLKKIERGILASPMRHVWEACAGAGKMEISPPPAAPLIHCIEMQAIFYSYRTASFNDSNYVMTIAAYTSAIEKADESTSVRSGASLRIALASFVIIHCRDYNLSKSIVSPLVDWVLDTVRIDDFHDLFDRAQDIKKKLTESRMSEFRDIAKAMSVTTGYNYGGSASDHWFECSNGHPFFIGECGQAMETSQCPECQAPVGGTSHTLLSSNRSVTGAFREALGN